MTDRPSLVQRLHAMAVGSDTDGDVLREAARRIKAAEDTLLSFTPGGSEYFSRDGDGYRVDIEACRRVIQEQRDSGIKAKIECARLRKASSGVVTCAT